MKHVFTLIIVFIAVQVAAFGQSNYKPGLLVITKGDTLKGYINYKEWHLNPKTFSFKKLLSDKEAQEFSFNTSSYFEITGMEAYEQYAGRISTDYSTINKLSRALDTSALKATVFLKVEQRGKNLVLLSYTDNIKTRFFIREHDLGKPQELGFRQYIGENNKIITQGIFKNQLWLLAEKYAVGSESLKQNIQNADYSLTNIGAIVSNINGLDKSQIKQIEGKNIRSRFFAGVALTGTKVDVEGEHFLANGASSKVSYMPKLSSGFDIILNPQVQRLFLRAELSFILTHANLSITNSETDQVREQTYREQGFDRIIAAVTPQIIYNLYNTEKIKFYLGGGVAFNLTSYRNIRYYAKYTYRSGSPTESEVRNNLKFESIYYSFPIRAGFILNENLEVSVVYSNPTSITNHLSYEFQTSSAQIGLNYFFGQAKK